MLKDKQFPVMTLEQMAEIDSLFQDITNKVGAFCDLNMLKMELKGRVHMGEGSTNFARVAVSHAEKHPEFTMVDFDVNTASKLFNNYEKLLILSRQMEQLSLILDNNCKIIGTEVMMFANNYYVMVKRMAAKGDPNAVVILNDLAARYQNMGRKSNGKSAAPPAS